MGKLLRPKDKLLISLAFLGDTFEEIRTVGGIVGASYKAVYGFVPQNFKKTNFANLVSRSLKTGNIEKVIEQDKVILRLTTQGINQVYRNFPLLKIKNKKWDGKWRIVVFDIPEKLHSARDRLRSKLKELGFGMLQQSIWITPHDFVEDLREFLAFHKLEEMVFVLDAKNIAGMDDKDLARKVFDLEKINEKYKDLIEEVTLKNKKSNMSKLKENFLLLLLKDPLLPEELLDKTWQGKRAIRIFMK